ncbi:hypothetical protein F7725_005041, partial [Dissostichus mawsoni]
WGPPLRVSVGARAHTVHPHAASILKVRHEAVLALQEHISVYKRPLSLSPHFLTMSSRLLSSLSSLLPSSLVLFFFVGAAFLLFLFLLVRPSAAGSLPSLPSLPLLGSLPWMGGGLPPHLLFTQLGHRYGPVFSLLLGPHLSVVLNRHQEAREVLLQRGREFAGRPFMMHRRLVHDSFTLFGEGSGRLQDIVRSSVDDLCLELLSGGGQGFDPSPAVTRAVTNVVCTLVFSSTYRHGDAELQEVMRYNDGIVETIAGGGLLDIYPWIKVPEVDPL